MTTQLLDTPAKLCTRCSVSKPRTEFSERWQGAHAKRYRASNAYCKTCASRIAMEKREADRASDRARQKKSRLKTTYGLTLEDFDELLSAQGGRCAICRTDTPGGKGRFHVDHCHSTGRIRGLLCCNCNRGIGALKDESALLHKAISYLEKSP